MYHSELLPMKHLFGRFPSLLSSYCKLLRVSKWENCKDVKIFGDIEPLFNLISINCTDPASPNPFIPSGKRHILHGPRPIYLMPFVGGFSDYYYSKRGVDNKPPTDTKFTKFFQHILIFYHDKMPRL